MNQYAFCWAVFVAVLCPVVLSTPGQPLAVTVAHMGLCLTMVALADRRERG